MICYIFDVDDTLVKYEDFNFKEWYNFIAEPVARDLGVPLTLDAWREIIEGKRSRRYSEEFGMPAEEFWRRVDERNLEYRKFMLREGRLKVYEDVAALELLKGKKAAWSTSSTACIEYVLGLFNLRKYFDLIIGKDYENYRHLEEVKPHPGFLRIIVDKLGCDGCVVIGDDEKDMLAAKRAGCMAILIKRRLQSSNFADYTINSLWELVKMDKKFL